MLGIDLAYAVAIADVGQQKTLAPERVVHPGAVEGVDVHPHLCLPALDAKVTSTVGFCAHRNGMTDSDEYLIHGYSKWWPGDAESPVSGINYSAIGAVMIARTPGALSR